MKTNRRDFLKSIAATAITAATGFAMSAVRVEEAEPTEAERRYAEMLSREQDHIDLVYIHLDSSDRIWAVSSRTDVYSSDDWGATWNLHEAGTVESVNDDGSINVETGDIPTIYGRPTYEPTEMTVKLDIHGVRTDGTG